MDSQKLNLQHQTLSSNQAHQSNSRKKMSKITKRRQGIDNITRLKICQFVSSQTTPPSTRTVLEWAQSTFGRSFPQSTISTLLRSNGLQIKQAGGRGRSCRTDSQALLASMRPDRKVRSQATGILVCHLKLLADGRCRGRASGHPEIELKVLEQTYLLLKRTTRPQTQITVAWFHELAQSLFDEQQDQGGDQQQKNVSQFLNQIYDKYYIMNMVFQYLFLDLPYPEMLFKLSQIYPDLAPTLCLLELGENDSDAEQEVEDQEEEEESKSTSTVSGSVSPLLPQPSQIPTLPVYINLSASPSCLSNNGDSLADDETLHHVHIQQHDQCYSILPLNQRPSYFEQQPQSTLWPAPPTPSPDYTLPQQLQQPQQQLQQQLQQQQQLRRPYTPKQIEDFDYTSYLTDNPF